MILFLYGGLWPISSDLFGWLFLFLLILRNFELALYALDYEYTTIQKLEVGIINII